MILVAIRALFLKAHGDAFTAAMPMSAAIRTLSGKTLGDRTLLLLALAVFVMTDVPLQRLQHAHRLKMSCHEIKDNMRARMREMTMRRMMARVPAADLVGINPTHCAVALKYDNKKMGAPRVVGKGAGLLATTIRDLAKEPNAPAPPVTVLARSLYAHAELDREVPTWRSSPPSRRCSPTCASCVPRSQGRSRCRPTFRG